VPQLSHGDLKVRIGVDLVAVTRIERLLHEHADMADELFTPGEIAYCKPKRRRMEHLAARFAAKEAVLKALGTGLGRRMSWTEVEVVNDRLGRPLVRLHGEVARWAAGHGLVEVDVSLSHTDGMAIAQAVAVVRSREADT
jgi:holo-[acyl-carrier protein] synthase